MVEELVFMKKSGLYLVIFIWIASLFVSCERQVPIARVGNYFIYARDLAERMDNQRAPSKTYSEIMKLVDDLVNDKLMLIDAYQSGFEHDSVVVARLDNYEQGQVYSHVVEEEVIDKIIPESKIKKRYRLLSKEWHVQHILLPASNDSLRTIQTLTELRSRILRGADFGELAREFSKDNKSAGKGGDLGFIQYDPKKQDDQFLQAMIHLAPGQVSDIVQTKQGFHLIKLIQVRDVDLPPYAQHRDRVKNDLIRENVALLDSAFYEFRTEIYAKYDAEQISENVDSLVTLIKSVEDANKEDKINFQRDPQQFREKLTKEQIHFQLARFTGGAYTFDDMIDTYTQISPMRRPLLNNLPEIEKFLNRNVPRKLMIRYGYEHGIDKTREMKELVQKERERQMISRIRRVKIDQNTEPSEEELLAVYNENPHQYEVGAEVKVQEIVVSDEEMARQVYEKAKSGDDFDALAREFNERLQTREADGVLGYLRQRDYGMVSREAVKMKSGEISEPIKSNGRYSIIKILDRKSGALEPFEDVRLQIRRVKRIEQRDKLTADWIASLKDSYPVAIYEDVLKKEFEIADE